MPQQPTFGSYTPTYINACNSPSKSGAWNQFSNAPIPTGLVPYRVISLSFSEAQALQAPSPSIEQLFEGDYQWVQVDSGATQSEVATGKAAYYKIQTASNSVDALVTVTGETGSSQSTPFAGVFLNPISVTNSLGLANGNWGWIFVGQGRVNVLYKSSLTSSPGAIGDQVAYGGGSGTFDDIGAQSVTPTAKVVGSAIVAPAANGTSPIFIRDPLFRM